MKTLMLNAVLSLFTNGGIPYEALRTQVLNALKNGSATRPDKLGFRGEHILYSGSSTVYENPGIPIEIYMSAGMYGFFRSHTVNLEDYVSTMSTGDQFRFTHIFLKSGDTKYLEKGVNVTMDYGDDVMIQASVSVDAGSSIDSASANEAVKGLVTGSCQEITNIQYTTTSNSSWTNAGELSWGGTGGYTAMASTPSLSSTPNGVRLVNTSYEPYATKTPTGNHTSGNSVKFQFDISA